MFGLVHMELVGIATLGNPRISISSASRTRIEACLRTLMKLTLRAGEMQMSTLPISLGWRSVIDRQTVSSGVRVLTRPARQISSACLPLRSRVTDRPGANVTERVHPRVRKQRPCHQSLNKVSNVTRTELEFNELSPVREC
ncbi:hypothetical protein J1614_009691 [Plenodomus biglobosus]|nr:hypothetical protein J1614_009691 [Plenodomus biglobosus]